MADVRSLYSTARAETPWHRPQWLTSHPSRLVMAAIVICALGLSFALTDAAASSRAVADAGHELTRLMRFMAVIKSMMASAAVGALFWRLGSDVPLGRFVAYSTCCAAMVAGPGLIWGMVHVSLGALLLHGGLIVLLVLLWRDPAVPVRLEAALALRRARRARAGR